VKSGQRREGKEGMEAQVRIELTRKGFADLAGGFAWLCTRFDMLTFQEDSVFMVQCLQTQLNGTRYIFRYAVT